MRDNFEACMTEVRLHEGGYVNHPNDPGGETNFGISKRSYPGLNIRRLTWDQAKAIYGRDFWAPLSGDDLPAGIDLVALDPGINSGVKRGAEWLQRALGVKADGVIGPKTIAAAQRARAMVVIRDACANRMGFLRGLKTWGSFGKGRSRRVASVEAAAVRMALTASGAGVVPVLQAQAEMADARALREQAKAGGSVVGGGGGITLADLPNWSLALIAIATLIALVIFIGNRRHERDRAAAWRNASLEVKS